MLSFGHLTAIVLLWPLMLPAPAKMVGSALLIISLFYYLRRYALLRSPNSVSGIEVSDEMVCMLNTPRGRIACTLLGSSFAAPYLTVLDLKPLKIDRTDKSLRRLDRYFSRSVVILPDGISPEEFRQLRVLLRWKWKDVKDTD